MLNAESAEYNAALKWTGKEITLVWPRIFLTRDGEEKSLDCYK